MWVSLGMGDDEDAPFTRQVHQTPSHVILHYCDKFDEKFEKAFLQLASNADYTISRYRIAE